MLHEWISQQQLTSNTAVLLADALRAIGRHDVIAQCMMDRQQQQVPDDISHQRHDAINTLVQRTPTTLSLLSHTY